MSRCVAALRRCVLDWLIDLVRDVKHEEAWAALPQRIILIRHGQAEHNLEEGAVRLACAAPPEGVSPAQPVPRVRWPALLAASRRYRLLRLRWRSGAPSRLAGPREGLKFAPRTRPSLALGRSCTRTTRTARRTTCAS